MDFAAMIETWRRVVLQPGEEVFQQEKTSPNANLQTAVIWMVIAGVVAAIFGFIQGLTAAGSVNMILDQADLPRDVAAQLRPLIGSMVGAGGLAAIITVPLFFLIGAGIYHLLARVLGGEGDYGIFAYLLATFQAPITMASAILGIVPFLGGCLAFLLTIYSLVMTYFAIRVNYNLPGGRAIAVLIIPVAVLLLLAFCAAFLIAGLAISAN